MQPKLIRMSIFCFHFHISWYNLIIGNFPAGKNWLIFSKYYCISHAAIALPIFEFQQKIICSSQPNYSIQLNQHRSSCANNSYLHSVRSIFIIFPCFWVRLIQSVFCIKTILWWEILGLHFHQPWQQTRHMCKNL